MRKSLHGYKPLFLLGKQYLLSRMAGWYGRCVPKYLRNCQSIFQGSYTFNSSIWGFQLPTPSSTVGLVSLLPLITLISVQWYFTVALICISLMTNGVENLFLFLLSSHMYSLEKYLFKSSIFTGLFVSLLLTSEKFYKYSGYKSFSDIQILSHNLWFPVVSVKEQKFYVFVMSNLSIFLMHCK